MKDAKVCVDTERGLVYIYPPNSIDHIVLQVAVMDKMCSDWMHQLQIPGKIKEYTENFAEFKYDHY